MVSERPDLTGGDFMNSRRLYHGAASYMIGRSVLDFGCGLGHGTYFLHPYTAKIVGYDIDSAVVEEANEMFGSHGLSFVSDLSSVKGIDMIVAVESIEHLEPDDLKEKLKLFSTMSPSIYSTTPNGDIFHYQPRRPEERIGFHTWHYTEDQLRELFGLYYSYVWVHGVLFDPRIKRHVGYAVYATNVIESPKGYLTDYTVQEFVN